MSGHRYTWVYNESAQVHQENTLVYMGTTQVYTDNIHGYTLIYTISVRAYTAAGPGEERRLTVTAATAKTCQLSTQ